MYLNSRLAKVAKKIKSRVKHDDLLYTLLQMGVLTLAISAPAIAPVGIFINTILNKDRELNKHKLKNSFYYFKKKGLISIESRRGETSILLTKKGERIAQFYRASKILFGNLSSVNHKWDGKWRVVIFDLTTEKNQERNAIRAMLRRCGFVLLQKSVWVYPHDCSSEFEFLRSFFKLDQKEFRLVISNNIGEDDYLKKHFKLST